MRIAHVTVIPNVYRETPRWHDEAGRHGIPRFFGTCCGTEYGALDPAMLDKLLNAHRMSAH